MLQFFSASTSIVNSKRAITECLENALEGQPNLDCDLIIIYTAMGHNFKDLLSEAHKLSPNAQIVGCSCGGVIGKEGPDESMKALAIMAVKGPKTEFAVSGLDFSVFSDPYTYGHQLAQDLKSKNPDINLILFDPSFTQTVYVLDKIIEGIESVIGDKVQIFGGLSFDGKMISDFQFIGETIFEKCAVMVGFADPTLELICQANHGLDVVGFPLEVTKSENNRVIELDGRNTWEILMDKLGLPLTTFPTIETMAISTLTAELPEKYHDEYGSRHKVAAGLIPGADGSIFTLFPSPEGSKLWLTRRNEQNIFDGVDWMMNRIIERLKGRVPLAVFHADCQARGRLLFNRIMKDEIINRLQFPICKGENIPWLGMYGGGEITPLGGKNHVHIYTSSLYVLVRRKE
jgi:hypothetical protein